MTLRPQLEAPLTVSDCATRHAIGHGWASNIIITATLVNLCYLRVWRWSLFLTPRDLFLRQDGPLFQIVQVGIFLVVLATLALWPVVAHARAGSGPLRVLAELAFLGTVIFAGVSLYAVSPTEWKSRPARLAGFAVILIVAVVVLRHRRSAVRMASGILLVFSPFTLITLAHAAHEYGVSATYHPEGGQLLPVRLTTRTSHRVLWVVFDEWDYRLTFSERPRGLSLPNVDRLLAESFSAEDATSPSVNTILSVPALLSGRRVRRFTPLSRDRAAIQFEGEATERAYPDGANIFAYARSKGYTTAALGWYLPYCRLFSASLCACAWTGTAYYVTLPSPPPPEMSDVRSVVQDQLRGLFATSFYTFGLENRRREAFGAEFGHLITLAERYSDDPTLDLVFLHIPSPHPPGICKYFVKTGCFQDEYIGNLQVLDKTLGIILGGLKGSDLLDHTVLVVSSDHPYRQSQIIDGKSDHRVPFLVRWPGESNRLVYDTPFNTVLSKDLILSILKGDITSSKGVAVWIDNKFKVGR